MGTMQKAPRHIRRGAFCSSNVTWSTLVAGVLAVPHALQLAGPADEKSAGHRLDLKVGRDLDEISDPHRKVKFVTRNLHPHMATTVIADLAHQPIFGQPNTLYPCVVRVVLLELVVLRLVPLSRKYRLSTQILCEPGRRVGRVKNRLHILNAQASTPKGSEELIDLIQRNTGLSYRHDGIPFIRPWVTTVVSREKRLSRIL